MATLRVRYNRDWHKSIGTVYIYFNNDAEGFAIKNAQTLREILGME